MTIRTVFPRAAAVFCIAFSTPAAAELPQPVKDMIAAAIATGDPAKVATVIEIARATNPGEGPALDAIEEDYKAEQARLAAEESAAEEAAIRSAGLFDNWSGSGEIGASRSTGNTETVGLSLGLKLERKGIDWTHRLQARADFQRSDGVITREQYFASYEPRYNIGDNAFLFGLAQFERNPFQGYSARYALSGGIGYRVIDGKRVQLSLKAGPAWRRTDFVDGSGESGIAALAGIDFDWTISDRLKFTQDANMLANAGGSAVVIVGGSNTSVNLVSGLEAKISDRFSTRLSYAIDYDSDPPAGAESLDTLTRFTLIYGF